METADIYMDLFAEQEHFPFPSFDKPNPIFHASNKKVIDKFRNEENDECITLFVGLRPKMYSFLIDDNGHTTEKLRVKGILMGATREIRHQQYVNQLQRHAEN